MSTTALRRRIAAAMGSAAPSSLVVDDALFAGSDIARLLTAHHDGAPLEVRSARIVDPVAGADELTVNGTASYLGVEDMDVELRFSGSETAPDFSIEYRLPPSWKFIDSFPDLPPTPDFRDGAASPGSTPFDLVGFENARLVLATHDHTDRYAGVQLGAGLSFVAELTPAGALGSIESAFTDEAHAVFVHGPIVRDASTPGLAPDAPDAASRTSAAGIDLRASSASALTLGSVSLGDASLRLYSPLQPASGRQDPESRPGVFLGGQLRVGSRLTLDMVAELVPGSALIQISSTIIGADLPSLSDLAGLVGGDDLADVLQSQLPTPRRISLESLDVAFDAVSHELFEVSVGVGVHDVSWAALDDHLTIDELSAVIRVTRPAGPNRRLSATAFGRAVVAGMETTVSVSLPDGFINAEIRPDADVALSTLMARYLPGVPPVSDLRIDRLVVGARPGRQLSLWAFLAEEPHPFTIEIGKRTLTISQCEAVVNYRVGSGFEAGFGGRLSIGGTELAVAVSMPGSVSLRGALPGGSLRALVEELIDDADWPDGFDIAFDAASIAFDKQNDDVSFLMAAAVDELGTLAFRVARAHGAWGFVASATLPGGFRFARLHESLSPLDSLFRCDALDVVVASVDDPSFVVPDLSPPGGPDAEPRPTASPTPRTVLRGLNLNATVAFGEANPVVVALNGSYASNGWHFAGTVTSPGGLSVTRLIADLTSTLAHELGGDSLLPDDGLDLPVDAAITSMSIEVAGEQITIVAEGKLDSGTIRLSLMRRSGTWRSFVQASGVRLPAELPVPEALAELMGHATLRWTPVALPSANRLGLPDGPVPAGLSLATALPLHLTPIGELLDLPHPTLIPIEYRPGAGVKFGFRYDILQRGDVIALGPLTINKLSVGYEAPAAFDVVLGCDLHLEILDTTTDLRFAGAIRADILKRDLQLGIAFLGEVRNDAPVPWEDPFGFEGLTIGAIELWVGTGIRALRGFVQLGRSSLDVDVIWSPTNALETAVHFAGESLTLQELLDGFLGSDAPQLPEPLGASGFESIAIDYAASTFDFNWLSGTRQYRQGLRGHAKVNLFGLEFGAVFDLEKRQMAGSMEPLELGKIAAIRAHSTPPAAPDWAAGFSDLGGPFVIVDLGTRPNGRLSAEVTLFGALSRSIDGTFDGHSLILAIEETVDASVLQWHTKLSVEFRNDGRASSFAIGGSLHAAIRINPHDLWSGLPDFDIVDVAVDLDVNARVSPQRASGSLEAAVVLWGQRLSFSIAVDLDLDFEEIGRRAVASLEELAKSILQFFTDLAEAVVKAVEAVVAAIEELGEAIVAAFGELVELGREIAEAFEELGLAIEAFFTDIGDELASWFGDDSGKRARELEKRRAEERHRQLQLDEDAKRVETRRAEEERRLLLIDVIENLADGAMSDPSIAADVQARIDRCELTGLNPFTQQPEWDPSSTRARADAWWHDALARARRRAELREAYLAALTAGDRQLDEATAHVETAKLDLARASVRLQDARAALAPLLAERARIRDAFDTAQKLVGLAREGWVKVEVALDEADALGTRLAEDRQRLAEDAALDPLVEELALSDDALEAELHRLEVLIAERAAHAQDAAQAFESATASLATAEATVALYRLCRSTLTLARLDAVRRSMTGELNGDDAFAAWVAICREAGSPARVNLAGLRPQAEEILRGLSDLTAEASRRAAEAVAASEAGGRDAPAPLTLAEVLDRIERVAVDPAAGADVLGDGPWLSSRLEGAPPERRRSLAPVDVVRPGALAVPPSELAEWVTGSPLTWAVVELHRRHGAGEVDAAVSDLIARWEHWRRIDAQHADARVRVDANRSLSVKLTAERARQRVLWARNQVGQHPRGTDLVFVLVPGTTYAVGEGRQRLSSVTSRRTDSLVGVVESIDDAEIVVRYWPDRLTTAFTGARPATYWIPTESVLRVRVWHLAIEFEQMVVGAFEEFAEQLSRATAGLVAIQPTAAAQLRAESELATLAAELPTARREVGLAFERVMVARHRWSIDAVRIAELTRLVSAEGLTGETGLLALGTGDRGAAVQRPVFASARDLAGRLAHAARPGPVAGLDEDALARFVSWTAAVAAHGEAVSAVASTLEAVDDGLRALVPDVLVRWRAGMLQAAAAAVSAGAGEDARRALTEAERELVAAKAMVSAVERQSTDALVGLTDSLRRELANRRAELDAVLESIRGLVLGDSSHMESAVGQLESLVAELGAGVAAVESAINEFDRLLGEQRASTASGSTLASLRALQLTVAASDDERLLRSVVARAEAMGGQVADLGARVSRLTARLATVGTQLDTFDTLLPAAKTGFTALADRFATLGARAATVAASLPALLERSVQLADAIRRQQQAIVDAHVALFAARSRSGLAIDHARLTVARSAAVRQLLHDLPATADPAAAITELVGTVQQAVGRLAAADADLLAVGEALERRIVATAAHWSEIDPGAHETLDRMRRELDATERAALGGVPQSIVTWSAGVGEVERTTPLPTSPDALLSAGFTLQFRLAAQPASPAEELITGPLGIRYAAGSLTFSNGDAAVSVSLPTSGRPVDIAFVAPGGRHGIIWIDGAPAGHLPPLAAEPIWALGAPPLNDPRPAEERTASGSVVLSDLRGWVRALGPHDVLRARHERPDPAEQGLFAHVAPDVLGPLALRPMTRPGVPDGCVLVRTEVGEVVVTDELRELTSPVVAVHLGAGAGVTMFTEPGFGGARRESFVDVVAAEDVRSIKVRSVMDELSSQRWVLQPATSAGAARFLAVERTAQGRLRTGTDVAAASLFRVAVIGPAAGDDVTIDVRSSLNDAPLTIGHDPACALPMASPDSLSETPALSAGADADLSSWLVSGAFGLRVTRPDPAAVRVVVSVQRDDVAFDLLRWVSGPERFRLVQLGGRFLVVAGESHIVAASRHVGRMSTATVSFGVGRDGATQLRVRTAEAEDRSGGQPMETPTGGFVGLVHRVVARWGDVSDTAAFEGDGTIRVGASDSVLDELVGTSNGSIRSTDVIGVGEQLTVAAWIRLQPGSRSTPWTAWSLLDADGHEVMAMGATPEARQAIRTTGGVLPVPNRLSTVRWSHVVVQLSAVDEASSKVVVTIDGGVEAEASLPFRVGGTVRVVAGDAVSSLDRFTLWTVPIEPDDIGAHLLRPSTAARRQPEVDWVIDPSSAVQGAVGVPGVWSAAPAYHPVAALTAVLARGAARRASGLLATVVGERFGHPAFRLSEVTSAGRRWIVVDDDGVVGSTADADAASVLGLRAIVTDRLPAGTDRLYFRAYGALGEDPAMTAESLGVPPATTSIVARELEWDEACRRARIDRVLAELDWLARATSAMAHARRTLAAGWIDVPLDGLDVDAAAQAVAAIGAALDPEPGRSGPIDVQAGGRHLAVELGEPPLAAVFDHWEALLDGLAGTGGADPVLVLLSRLGASLPDGAPTADDVRRALHATGARPTEPALGWDPALWREALRTWTPGTSNRLRDRHERLGTAGIDARPMVATLDAPAPIPDVGAVRRAALVAAAAALAALPGRPPDAATLAARVRLDLLLALPLGLTGRSWLTEAVTRGIPLDTVLGG